MKRHLITGNFVSLKSVSYEDSEFIAEFRNRFQNFKKDGKTFTPESQLTWFKNNVEAMPNYFIILCSKGRQIGTVRLHNFDNKKCNFGSFAIEPSSNKFAALEAVCLVLRFGFNQGIDRIVGVVEPNNKSIERLFENLGAQINRENEIVVQWEKKVCDVLLKDIIKKISAFC